MRTERRADTGRLTTQPAAARPPLELLPATLWANLVRPLLIIVVLSLLAGTLAYQAPPEGHVRVGWLGDQLFLESSVGLGGDAIEQGFFYADDLTPDSPTGRSRWTRQRAEITLPNLGGGTDLELTLLAQGWPTDTLNTSVAQPDIRVLVDGTPVGTFQPTPTWGEYRVTVPASARTSADLNLTLESSATFTDTVRGPDSRPKGLRLAEVQVQPTSVNLLDTSFHPPAWRALALLTLALLLLYALLARLPVTLPTVFVLATLFAGASGIGLAVARIWMGAALNVALTVLTVALLVAWHQPLLALFRAMLRRFSQGRALGYGLVTAGLAWLGYTIHALARDWQVPGLFWENFPDSLLYGLLSAGLLALALVLGRKGLPRISDGIVTWISTPKAALALLLVFGAVWLGWQASVIAALARNLVAGRGWVVDYVTQFYKLYPSVTRDQETWPLLQPVWIAPFFALFGPEEWAAKIPNLIFNAILLLLVYHIGARVWDRRVGLTAAIIVLTNFLFFRLTIFVTNDLGFVVFVLGAIWLLYLWHENEERRTQNADSAASSLIVHRSSFKYLLGAGALTGLMMLQKPSGAMLAVGMGLWLLAHCWPQLGDWRQVPLKALAGRVLVALRPVVIWSVVALLVLSPYLVRNMVLFGRPVYSTESYDAWVLGYRGRDGDAWNDIYQVFTPELGGPGVPDRSWVLRWGFDYTLAKFNTQVVFLRDYLMPMWNGLPDGLQPLVSGSAKSILQPLGAWLAFLGLIAALRVRRRLLGLLFSTFTPYVIFMMTYWRTDEERYWVMLIPWLALLAAWAIWAGFDRLASIGDRRWSPLALILVLVAVTGVVSPSWNGDISRQIRETPGLWQPDITAYAWLRQHTPPGTVVLARNPWQMNWHSERPGLMIPNTHDRNLMLEIARRYNAEYIIFENLTRLKGKADDALAPLIPRTGAKRRVGEVVEGFTLVYASPTEDNLVYIYRLPKP
jgi:4-amino-4-deoxy-L-arabinose transferase-like glycosyltransferase